tara:strand:+ start:587 stop:721 length:135 start_codon:yes stop_codon:yes gene_type:complete
MENFINQELTTGLFFSLFFGVGLVGFFVFLLFWLANQQSMFETK